MKKLLLMCCFVAGISAVSFAQGGGGGRGGFNQTPDQQVARLKTQIPSLTDDQSSKLKAIYEAQGKSRDSLMKAANGDMSSIRDKFMPMMQATQAKVKAVLTADQAAAYQKAQDEMRARFQQGGGGGGGGNN